VASIAPNGVGKSFRFMTESETWHEIFPRYRRSGEAGRLNRKP
jgi:hypothetical protein